MTPPCRRLLTNARIQFQRTRIVKVSLSRGQITLDSNTPLRCSHLILTLNNAAPLSVTPNITRRTLPFHALRSTCRLGRQLQVLRTSRTSGVHITMINNNCDNMRLTYGMTRRLNSHNQIHLIRQASALLHASPRRGHRTTRGILSSLNI